MAIFKRFGSIRFLKGVLCTGCVAWQGDVYMSVQHGDYKFPALHGITPAAYMQAGLGLVLAVAGMISRVAHVFDPVAASEIRFAALRFISGLLPHVCKAFHRILLA